MSGLLLGILASSLPSGGDYESIATVTVGSGGASSIEFTSIPGTYQHLQIRFIARTTDSPVGANSPILVQINGVTTVSNYAVHLLSGNGSAASAYGSDADWIQAVASAANASASIFGAAVFDILDYANTSKNTTVRGFSGVDLNGSGIVRLTSGLWESTSAVTSILLKSNANNLAQHSTAALYGIKAP